MARRDDEDDGRYRGREDDDKERVQLDEFDLGIEKMKTPDTVECETTLHLSEPITGRKAVTYIIRRFRRSQEGDTLFLTAVVGNEAKKVILPPKVMAALARQDAALTTKLQRQNGRRLAEDRKRQGIAPGFLKKAAG